MRRLWILLLLLIPMLLPAQTTVNLSVTDADNQAWYSSSWSVSLISGSPGQAFNPSIINGGGSLARQSGTLSSTGTVTITLPANANIGPAGTLWQFVVCPPVSSGCFTQNVTVTVSSPMTLPLAPPGIRINYQAATPPVVAYSSAEIVGAGIGVQFTQLGLTIGTPQAFYCTAATGSNCTTWTPFGSGAGGTPASPFNSIQKNNAGVFGASNITDNGTTVVVNEDAQFKGPNPGYDLRNYARAVSTAPSATCTMTSGAVTVTLNVASTYQNGDGVVCIGAGTTNPLSTPTAPTVTPSTANYLTGTNNAVASIAGTNTNQYQVIARTKDGALTAASPVTSITTAQTLGAQSAAISSISAVANTVTVTLSTPHDFPSNCSFCAFVIVDGTNGFDGFQSVVTAPTSTTFTFTTGNDTRNGGPTSGGSSGTVNWFNVNHISWTAVTNAYQYYICGRTAGSNNIIGVSYPQNTNLSADPTYNTWDDYGPTMTTLPSLPSYVPTSGCPSVATNGNLSTTIVSGAGTTTLTLANAASNTVSSANLLYDIGPNLLTAANAAVSNKGVLVIPFVPGASFNTQSVVALPNSLQVLQSGQVGLGETLLLGCDTQWSGWMSNADRTQFGMGGYPIIYDSSAYPGIYSQTGCSTADFDHLNIYGTSPNQLLYLEDSYSGGIPDSVFDHVVFDTKGGPSDYLGKAFVLRATQNGGTGVFFRFVNFGGGPNQTLFSTATPLVTINPNGFNGFIAKFENVFFNRRGVAFYNGAIADFDWSYIQGGITPLISISGSGASQVRLDIRHNVMDTTQTPIVWNSGGTVGLIKITDSNGSASGRPSISGAPIPLQLAAIPASAVIGSNDFQESAPVVGVNGSSTSVAIKTLNAIQSTGQAGNVNNIMLPPIAPSGCVVSAGGTVSVGAHTYQLTGVDWDLNETLMGPSVSVTTTTGNQTVTCNVPAFSNGMRGYDVYRDAFRFLGSTCGPPAAPQITVSGGSFVDSGGTCGVGSPTVNAAGSSYMSASGVSTWQFRLNGSNVLTGVKGNSGFLEQCSGTLTNGNLASFDANGNCVDSGVAKTVPFANPMTTLGDSIGGGTSGVATRVAGPTAPNGVPQSWSSIPASGAATLEQWVLPGLVTRTVTGTTATDTLASTDCNPKRVAYQTSVAVAVTLPTATTLGVANCVFRLTNNTSTPSDVTVTPTTWTIVPVNPLVIHAGQFCTIQPDQTVSTQWDADCTDEQIVPGSGITITRGQYGPTIATTFGVVYNTPSASTFNAISLTTMATAGGSGDVYHMDFPYITQTVLGIGCTGGTLQIVPFIHWTDPNASSFSEAAQWGSGSTFQISSNGALGQIGSLNSGTEIVAKAGTVVQYKTTVTNTLTGCTTTPQYKIYPVLTLTQ